MSMNEQEILKIIHKQDPSGALSRQKYLDKHYPSILKYILNFANTHNLIGMSITQIKWHIIHDIKSVPACKECNKKLKYKNATIGYPTFCSPSCTSKNLESQQKLKNTIFKNHGVTHSSLTKKSILKRQNKKISTIKKMCETSHIEFIELDQENRVVARCNTTNKTFKLNIGSFHNRYAKKLELCGVCLQYKYSSKTELEIIKYLKDFKSDLNYTQKDRKTLNGKEIDILLPDEKIGIEYNGVYWHSEIFKSNTAHKDKVDLSETKNIHLIQIWEDDWIYKNDIVKSRLKNILGQSRKIYARKTIIKEVSHYDATNFLNDNHLQGTVIAKYRYGLYYNNELISFMSFGKMRKSLGQSNVESQYEMYRFCNKLNLSVVGGASKLFKHFISVYSPTKIVSYADRNWSNGNLYEQLDFNFEYNTEPGYFYVIDGIRQHRFKWRKDILVKLGYDKNKTEREIMNELGYYRIYDAGHKKYEWTNFKSST